MTRPAEPTAVRPKRVRTASTAAVTSCHDCSRAIALSTCSPTPSPRSNDSWSVPPAISPEALTPRSRMPSPGSTVASSAAATWPMAPPVVSGRAEVCERVTSERSLNLIFTVTVRADDDASAQHGGDRLGHAQRVALELGRVDQVVRERLLVTDGLGLAIRAHRVGIRAAGQRRQVGAARLAQAADHRVEGQFGQVAHRAHAEIVEPARRRRADAPQRLDVVAVQELELDRRIDEVDAGPRLQALTRRPGLGGPRGQLGDHFGTADADRTPEAELVAHPVAQAVGDPLGWTE